MIINSKELSTIVSNVTKAVGNNPIIPILETIKFDLNDGQLTITGSDTKTTIVSKSNIDSKEKISVCIPAKIFGDTLKKIPSQGIDIKVDDKFQVTIKTDKSKFKIAGENPKDFIITPPIEAKNSFTIDSTELKHAISKTAFACSNDDLRPVMTGFYIDSNSDRLNLVTTDSIMLSVYNMTSIGDVKMVVFKHPMLIVGSFCEGDVLINSSDRAIEFNFDSNSVNYTVTSQLIEGNPIPYEVIIPKENPIKAILNKNELIGALSRLDSFTNAVNAIVLNFTDSSLVVIAENTDYNNEATETIDCTCNEPLKIGFNAKKLMDIIKVISGDEITFNLKAYNSITTITGSSDAELFLIMPVMIG